MKRIPLVLLAALVAGPLTLLAGCDAAGPTALDGATADARPAKVDVCHYDADAEAYALLTLPAPAIAPHLAHGDAYPESEGLDANCEPVEVDPVELWDNGSMVTHPGAGAGGADVSMASVSDNSAGSNVQWILPDGQHFRIADDFTVDPDGWHLSAIVTYAYELSAAVPSWTGFNANIWDGPPSDAGSTVVATTTTASTEFTGIYRVMPGAGNLGNTDRPVYAITWDLSGEYLAAGEYWVDWQVEGGTNAWAPYVMELIGDSPATVLGNGQQFILPLEPPVAEWRPIMTVHYPASDGVETPFQVIGSTLGPLAAPVPTPEALRAVPAPTTTALGSPETASSQATDTQQQ